LIVSEFEIMTSVSVYLILLLLVSAVTFFIWGWDKSAAINGKWRIPERTLLILVMFGGAVGGALGMVFFRHKTRMPLFRVGLWVAGTLQLAIFYLLLTRPA